MIKSVPEPRYKVIAQFRLWQGPQERRTLFDHAPVTTTRRALIKVLLKGPYVLLCRVSVYEIGKILEVFGTSH